MLRTVDPFGLAYQWRGCTVACRWQGGDQLQLFRKPLSSSNFFFPYDRSVRSQPTSERDIGMCNDTSVAEQTKELSLEPSKIRGGA